MFHTLDKFLIGFVRYRLQDTYIDPPGRTGHAPGSEESVRIEIVPSGRLGARGAELVARTLRDAVAARGRATVAFSGGSTPRPLLVALAGGDVPWSRVDVLQVDERVAPQGHEARNLTALRSCLLDHVPLPPDRLHAMPVDAADLEAAAADYARTLRDLAGRPPILDLVHLGLGEDGHTASLVPDLLWFADEGSEQGDEGGDRGVATTPCFHGYRRMTLTPSVLSRARRLLWFVSGAAKARVVRELVERNPAIPAGRIDTARAVLLLDEPAARDLGRPPG